MIAVHIEMSKEKGLLLVIYKQHSREGIYGIEVKPKDLDDALERGICYKVTLDSLVKVEEVRVEEEEEPQAVKKAVESFNPFTGDPEQWKEIE